MSEQEDIQLHDLRPAPGAKKDRKRIARGNSGRGGTYAGRGRKGQNSRSGGNKQPWFRGMSTRMNRMPYMRGAKFRFTGHTRTEYRIINVRELEEEFSSDDEITPEVLLERGLIKKAKMPLKILGDGELTKPLNVVAHAFSSSAREKIEAAGGEAVEVEYSD